MTTDERNDNKKGVILWLTEDRTPKKSLIIVTAGILSTCLLYYMFNVWFNQPPIPMPDHPEEECVPNYFGMGGCD